MSIDQADVWEETGHNRESSRPNTKATDPAPTYRLKPSERTYSVLHGSPEGLVKVELICQTMPGMNGRIHKIRRDIAEDLIKNGKARAV
mgnify:CR=1 FL=1